MTNEDIKAAAKLIDQIAALESRLGCGLVIAFKWEGGGQRGQGFEHFPLDAGDVGAELRAIVQRAIEQKQAELDRLIAPIEAEGGDAK